MLTFDFKHFKLKGSTKQNGNAPSMLSSVPSQSEQNEEKPVKYPRPDTSQMTPFKPAAGAGKSLIKVFNLDLKI